MRGGGGSFTREYEGKVSYENSLNMTVADFPRGELSSGWSFIWVDFHWGGLSRGGGGGEGGLSWGGGRGL